jgi:hypothetical protein
VGLHQHTGSDFKNANVIIEAAEKLFDLTFKYFPNIQFIDLGSGFKVAYKEDDHITDMEKLGEGVVKVFNDFCLKFGRDVELWFEPGKFLVSESGYLLARANVVKYSPERNFIGVDSGLNHLIRPMMYDAYHEIINGSNNTGFLGDVPGIKKYLSEIGCNNSTSTALSNYLSIISRRASGSLPTTARWMRDFIKSHPKYDVNDSDTVPFEVAKDMLDKCESIGG